MALPSRPGRKPQPSSTMRTTGPFVLSGMRVLRLVVILEGMQVSQIVRALPVMLSVAVAQAAPAQTAVHYRVTANNAWFYQDVGGRAIALPPTGGCMSRAMAGYSVALWSLLPTSPTRARRRHPIQTVSLGLLRLRRPRQPGDSIRPALNRSA